MTFRTARRKHLSDSVLARIPVTPITRTPSLVYAQNAQRQTIVFKRWIDDVIFGNKERPFVVIIQYFFFKSCHFKGCCITFSELFIYFSGAEVENICAASSLELDWGASLKFLARASRSQTRPSQHIWAQPRSETTRKLSCAQKQHPRRATCDDGRSFCEVCPRFFVTVPELFRLELLADSLDFGRWPWASIEFLEHVHVCNMYR
jgi:hypothetical protein